MDKDIYRSSDMSVVTYLRVGGFEVQDVTWEEHSNSCYWIFNMSSTLMSAVEQYREGTALVNPREFNKEFSRTRGELFGHLPAKRYN